MLQQVIQECKKRRPEYLIVCYRIQLGCHREKTRRCAAFTRKLVRLPLTRAARQKSHSVSCRKYCEALVTGQTRFVIVM